MEEFIKKYWYLILVGVIVFTAVGLSMVKIITEENEAKKELNEQVEVLVAGLNQDGVVGYRFERDIWVSSVNPDITLYRLVLYKNDREEEYIVEEQDGKLLKPILEEG